MAEDWIEAFGPNADGLLDLLLQEIDDDMLVQIASADYGNEVEQHLTPLKVFRDRRIIPVLDWHPAEVLELIRWSEPDKPGWQPGDEGRRGHLLRAFACSLLLRSRERKENDSYDSYGDTSVQLERSIHALGRQSAPVRVSSHGASRTDRTGSKLARSGYSLAWRCYPLQSGTPRPAKMRWWPFADGLMIACPQGGLKVQNGFHPTCVA